MDKSATPFQSGIDIEHLSIGYLMRGGDVHVVARDINATIFPGELTCLLGANGVGKSTLLRTLAAFQPKLSGIIRIEGQDMEQYSHNRLSRLIGVVLTERVNARGLTVSEVVSLGRTPYTGFWGHLDSSDRHAVEHAIELTGIGRLRHRQIHTLSDGERQRVMIAKALAQDTPVIYLDEPTAYLDYPGKVEMMQLLHYLSRETGKVIFLSTHDLELALQLADRLWLMRHAEGIATGTPEDLALDGRLERFINHPGIVFDYDRGLFSVAPVCTKFLYLEGEGRQMNMIAKALRRNGIATEKEDVTHPLPCIGRLYVENETGDNGRACYVLQHIRRYKVNNVAALIDIVRTLEALPSNPVSSYGKNTGTMKSV